MVVSGSVDPALGIGDEESRDFCQMVALQRKYKKVSEVFANLNGQLRICDSSTLEK